MKVKTQIAIEKAGSSTALAELLGISKGAVSLWGDDIPEERAKLLVELRPQWFPEIAAHLAGALRQKIERLESANTESPNALKAGDALGYNALNEPAPNDVTAGKGKA